MAPLRWFRDLLSTSLRHPLSLLGGVLAGGSAAVMVTVLALDLFGFHSNPYAGVVLFLILPAVFVLGLVLVPVGAWIDRRRGGVYPVLDLNDPRHRSRLLGFAVVSFVNLILMATVSYRGVEHMDSVRFCGETCHSVMRPESTAHKRSPHARVKCVACHTGPGAGGFVRSKLAGVGQLLALTLGTYERPIPVPVRNLRPARETCEQCHWPAKFHGDRIKVRTTYSEDAANTERKTVLRLKIGGGSPDSGYGSGIHWHMNLANEVTYVAADETRQTIPWIRVRARDGRVTEYLAAGAETPDEAAIRERGRLMDCVDCHNRPTHIYRLPDDEVDEALQTGRLDRTLPYLKKAAVTVLSLSVPPGGRSDEVLPAALLAFYRDNAPDTARDRPQDIRRAGAVLAELHDLNVFPEMKITWGTYANNIGHMDSPGCFRCHDGDHASPDGRVISSECETCHSLLAVEEENPEILGKLFPSTE